MLAYLALRGIAPGPLFLLQDGRPLTRTLLTNWLRQILAAAGVPGNFSSHSFCIGTATAAQWSAGSPHSSPGEVDQQCLSALHQNSCISFGWPLSSPGLAVGVGLVW